ncbi:MAG: dihydrodipicolinate synthase family protein [Phycisphaeraceae bacterium]
MTPLIVRVTEVGLNWLNLKKPPAPLILAGVGMLVLFFAMFLLIFRRGTKAPERSDPRTRGLLSVPTERAAPPPDHLREAPKVQSPSDESKAIAEAAAAAAAVAREHRTHNVMEDVSPSQPQAPSVTAPRGTDYPMPSAAVLAALRQGTVIPAHPLALNQNREFNERRMRALTRYYLAAGVGGVAVAVHTTQFELRKPKHNLLRPVLSIVGSEVAAFEKASGRSIVKIAGICGVTHEAVAEATVARDNGYDAGLLNLSAVPESASEFDLIEHCKQIARVIPLVGFYLQPAIGGRALPYAFWRLFAEIPNVVAIKIAAFNRYSTIDVMRAVAEAGRAIGHDTTHPIAMYTGNDDNIVDDLLGDWSFDVNGKQVSHRIVGGLLGQWACWTRAAVDVFESLKHVNQNGSIPIASAALNRQVTDMNAAVFDAANNFKGCIPGIHEVLRRQGLLDNTLCLDGHVFLSPGQADAITRVRKAYPHLTDDDFVAQHRDEWLR